MKSYCEYGYNQYGLVNSLRGLVVGDVIGRETLAKLTVETGLVKWTAYFSFGLDQASLQLRIR